MSIAVRNNMHFVLYCYCCKGWYSLEICGKVREFDNDWRVATLIMVPFSRLDVVKLAASSNHL